MIFYSNQILVKPVPQEQSCLTNIQRYNTFLEALPDYVTGNLDLKRLLCLFLDEIEGLYHVSRRDNYFVHKILNWSESTYKDLWEFFIPIIVHFFRKGLYDHTIRSNQNFGKLIYRVVDRYATICCHLNHKCISDYFQKINDLFTKMVLNFSVSYQNTGLHICFRHNYLNRLEILDEENNYVLDYQPRYMAYPMHVLYAVLEKRVSSKTLHVGVEASPVFPDGDREASDYYLFSVPVYKGKEAGKFRVRSITRKVNRTNLKVGSIPFHPVFQKQNRITPTVPEQLRALGLIVVEANKEIRCFK